MNNAIISHWTNGNQELPGLDGIYYADGTVTVMSYIVIDDRATGEKTVNFCPLCDTTISSLEKYDNVWTGIETYVKADYRGGTLYGGDGAYEGTGFLACENEQGDFVWAIFFERSEPIIKILVQDESIIAWGKEEYPTQLKITVNGNNLTEIHMELSSLRNT